MKNNQLGQLFMIGLEKEKLNQDEKDFLKKLQPSGVIYFRRNVESPSQLKRLSQSVTKLSDVPPLIGIDQEGGKVARLGPPFTEFPGNIFLGRYFQKTKSVQLIRSQSEAMALELKSIGVNYNFTPVADIDSNKKNPIIGGLGRSFGQSPKLVAKLVYETVKTYNSEKVVSCAKHFPGHGDTFSDSHKVLPVVKATQKVLFQRELVPFRAAFRAKVPTLMTAHVVYPALDPDRPATLSSKIMENLLRKKMRYEGVVVSDDLEMKAIASHGLIKDAAVEALAAGVDMLLVCKSLHQAEQAWRNVEKASQKSPTLRMKIDRSLIRIQQMKEKFLHTQTPTLLTPHDFAVHQELARTISHYT